VPHLAHEVRDVDGHVRRRAARLAAAVEAPALARDAHRHVRRDQILAVEDEHARAAVPEHLRHAVGEGRARRVVVRRPGHVGPGRAEARVAPVAEPALHELDADGLRAGRARAGQGQLAGYGRERLRRRLAQEVRREELEGRGHGLLDGRGRAVVPRRGQKARPFREGADDAAVAAVDRVVRGAGAGAERIVGPRQVAVEPLAQRAPAARGFRHAAPGPAVVLVVDARQQRLPGEAAARVVRLAYEARR